jgi:dTDP-4-dehydrorhamnose reductase
LDLLVDGEHGIWHLANSGKVNWAGFARLVAQKAGYDAKRVHSRPSRLLGFKARRPAFSVISSERASLMPSLEDGLERYFEARQWNQAPEADATGFGSGKSK